VPLNWLVDDALSISTQVINNIKLNIKENIRFVARNSKRKK
jgi:hypothetical protein